MDAESRCQKLVSRGQVKTLLTVAEAAAMLGVNVQTIKRGGVKFIV